MEHVNGWCFRGIYKGGLWEDDLHVSAHDSFFSARPRSAEYTIGICVETARKTKAFECFFSGFQHSL